MPIYVTCPSCNTSVRSGFQMSREALESGSNTISGNRQQCSNCGHMIPVSNDVMEWKDE